MKRFIFRAARVNDCAANVKDVWEVVITEPGAALEPVYQHRLQFLGAAGQSFPQSAEAPPDATQPHYALCTTSDAQDIRRALNETLKRPVPPGLAVAVGRYLFATLFGKEGWEKVIDRVLPAEPIELALCWEAMANALSALPWEMLHGPNGFLAGDIERPVAITRLVPSPAGNIRALPAPLRVLFVVGSKPEDTAIRPGAEYLGLLRHLDAQEMAQDDADAGFHSRILIQATSEQLEQEIKRFAPSVVHFICHGGVEKHGEAYNGYLLLAPAPGETEPAKMTADNLLPLLSMARSAPAAGAGGQGEAGPRAFPAEGLKRMLPIVILNACKTASYDKAKETLPLAAELIAGGVPIVIGMAGEVSDQACRLFTRRFYEALVRSHSIVGATTEGRLAGIVHLSSPTDDLDWALPTLFLAERVSPCIQVDAATGAKWSGIKIMVRKYARMNNPTMLCGRFDVLEEAYQKLLRAGTGGIMTALALGVPSLDVELEKPQYGKTRLLEQLAAQSVRDGCLPCLTTFQEGDTIPGKLLEIAIRMFEDVLMTRRIFKLDDQPRSAVLDYAEDVVRHNLPTFVAPARYAFRQEELTKAVRGLPADAVGVANDAEIGNALRSDLARLKEDAHGMYPSAQPLVLVDEVHRFGSAADDFLHLIGVDGLGGPLAPIGVVIAFSRNLPQVEYKTPMQDLKEFWEAGYKHVNYVNLTAFDHPKADTLPYRQFLLTYDPPLTIRPNANPNDLNDWLDVLHDAVRGVPSQMEKNKKSNKGVAIAVKAGITLAKIVEQADDEAALNLVRERTHGHIFT